MSTWSLLIKLFELIPERKNIDIKTNQKFIYLFHKRSGLSFPTRTHIRQLLSENCFIEALLFFKEIWDKRINLKFWDVIIGSMDETTIFFNMSPSKTITKKGGKSILIRTQNQEKCRIFCYFDDNCKWAQITAISNI